MDSYILKKCSLKLIFAFKEIWRNYVKRYEYIFNFLNKDHLVNVYLWSVTLFLVCLSVIIMFKYFLWIFLCLLLEFKLQRM